MACGTLLGVSDADSILVIRCTRVRFNACKLQHDMDVMIAHSQ